MGFLSNFEGKIEDTMEGTAGRMSNAPISPVQIAKKAERAMRREKMVGAGKQYAPTLYTVLVNVDDDRHLFGMYPTLAGEIETYLSAKALDSGLTMDGQPLVRFIADESLKHGKFQIIAEAVAAPIIAQLRQEEMTRYGLIQNQAYGTNNYGQQAGGYNLQQRGGYAQPAAASAAASVANDPYAPSELPYVPEDEIDRSIDYGEYTFNSQDFDNYQNGGAQPAIAVAPIAAVQNQQNAEGPRLIDTKSGRTYKLRGRQSMAGRGQDCDIVISDINASRHHALFNLEPHGVWTIADQGSTNGTLINGRVISGAETLYEGDQVTMGLTNLTFTMA